MNSKVKTCQNSGKSKYCMGDFEITPDDFTFYDKIKVPPPTFCPTCRLIRKLVWRNERTLYHRVCSMCNKKIISIYDEDHTFPVYCSNCWNNDHWDAFSFGITVSQNNFFYGIKELFSTAPRPALDVVNSVNSEYTNHTEHVKNCYLTFGAIELENGYYDDQCYFGKDIFDSDLIIKSDSLYESGNCMECFNVFYSEYSVSCLDSYFLYDCVGCTNCVGCMNLRNQSYCIFNVQYSKDEYFKKIDKYVLSSFKSVSKIKEDFAKFKLTQVHRFVFMKNSFDSTGNNIEHSSNCKNCFDLRGGTENLKFSVLCGYNMKDSYDVYGGGIASDLGYESISFTGDHNVLFSKQVRLSTNVSYSEFCTNCHDLFACVGLKNKSYCIFNQQYSKEEYFRIVENLIKNSINKPYISKLGHSYSYGEFFPIEFTNMGYDESAAQKFFPLTKIEVLESGYFWKGEKERNYTIEIYPNELNDNISDITESVIGKTIACSHDLLCNHKCTQAFRILKNEFDFYKKHSIPLPRECPNCRYVIRNNKRNPLKLWSRSCMNPSSPDFNNGQCQNTFQTSYSPERQEKVYCDDCYKREVL